jgi:hypothetical protein
MRRLLGLALWLLRLEFKTPPLSQIGAPLTHCAGPVTDGRSADTIALELCLNAAVFTIFNISGEKVMTTVRRTLAGLVVFSCLGWTALAHADDDAVTFWNAITVRAVTIGRPGPVGFLDVALVQAAVHDAVQAIEGRFEPYHAAIPNAFGSPAAAVAAATHDVLVGLYPAQQGALDSDYLGYLQANGMIGDPGLTAGQQAATALLTQYRPAPNPPLPPYVGGTRLGEWRPTPSYIGTPPAPPPFSPMATLYLAFTTPFTLHQPSQFRPQPPPPLRSTRYARDYDEVKEYGSRFNSARTPAQTDLAYFWTDNVVAQWNRVLRAIADAHLPEAGDSARLLALANLATADALIACWDGKHHFSFWRPVTAIQEGDDDGNPRTVGDSTWEPLINTPNYPEYPSGATNVAAAMTAMLEHFFGTDNVHFTVASNAPLVVQKTRTFSRFSDAAREVVDARILLGIHFRSADEQARRQGSRVAHWTFRKFLRPIGGSDR